ncbi:MAG: hypothetical protein EA367_16940 [Leptolyngbya sp. DLM2.Bin15]|nr:MAG: hypothetical protein EA367_16940 [Leptolyngbya sp. DLM2.Bin15]
MKTAITSIQSWVSALIDSKRALTPLEISVLKTLACASESPVALEQYLSENIATVYASLTKLERLGLVRATWVTNPEHPVSSNEYRQRRYEITVRGRARLPHTMSSVHEVLVSQSGQII